MVDSVWTSMGQLTREADPARQEWDLVIAHTLHPSADHAWLATVPLLLDAAYGLPELPQRRVL